MIKYENHCCGCAVPAYPCMGDACPNINVPVYYCDICDNGTYAEYEIDDGHYCEKCAKEYFKEMFESLSVDEQAHMFNYSLRTFED